MFVPSLRYVPLLIVPIMLAGCLSTPTVTPTRYYTLEVAPEIAQGAPMERSLGIRPLGSARPYKLEIAHKADPHRLAYFPRVEWAESPATAINRALTDGIRATNRFSDVGDAADMIRPDYILTGELRHFEADYTLESPKAVVEVALTIRSTSGPGTLWEGIVRSEAPLGSAGAPESADMDAVAAAMSSAVTSLVEMVTAHVNQS